MSPVLRHNGCGVPLADAVVETTNDENRYIIRASIQKEPMTRSDWTTHDYNVHFCLGIENPDNDAIDLELQVNDGRWENLPEIRPLIFIANDPTGPFQETALKGRTDLKKQYVLRLSLAPGAVIYVANHLPRNLEGMDETFSMLARDGGATAATIGTSCEGRPITSYTYGDPTILPTILIVSGVHPPEPDTFSSEEIMKWLSSPAASTLRQQKSITLVPIANPDGFANRTQAANASGINFFWDFACDRPKECPEAFALWKIAKQTQPQAYIDFHGYTFQLKKEPGPYVRPLQFYGSREVKHAASSLYKDLAKNREFASVTGFYTYAPQTLGSLLAENFDTITISKFHVHLKYGVAGCRRHGLTAFQAVVEAMSLLPSEKSAGYQPLPLLRRLSRRIREVWAGILRPAIGHFRRGQFRQINFTRRSTVHF
jgi:hypothetical protein